MEDEALVLPSFDDKGALDRRYDVRIAKRIAALQSVIDALELRVEALEA